MRTLAGLTAAIMACMTLWSCDQQPAAPAAPPAQACNCAPPAPVAAVPPPAAAPVQTAAVQAPVYRHRHRHHYSAYSETSYAGQSAQADYDYVSTSQAYAPPPPPRGVGWTDGYGRPHFVSEWEAARDARKDAIDATYLPQRMDPWHKYGADCQWR